MLLDHGDLRWHEISMEGSSRGTDSISSLLRVVFFLVQHYSTRPSSPGPIPLAVKFKPSEACLWRELYLAQPRHTSVSYRASCGASLASDSATPVSCDEVTDLQVLSCAVRGSDMCV